MRIKDFTPFLGKHCETTTAGTLLSQLGIDLSEPLLFGIGEGLGFIFWKMKTMSFPFIGGRVKTDLLTENLCRNLGLSLEVKETSSLKKAWNNIEREIEQGKLVGLKLDCYHLEYFNTKVHFAGHYVAMYGYDEKDAFLVDTDQQGRCVKTSLESLALARNEKGPMSSRNMSYVIQKTKAIPNLEDVIRKAIYQNAKEYLNPPIKNLYYKGILKTASEIKTWFDQSKDIKHEFHTSAMLMERAGTGGALFRNLYRDFLKESYELTGDKVLSKVHDEFVHIAKLWTELADLFQKIGDTNDRSYLDKASDVLLDLSNLEKEAVEKLYAAYT